MKNITIIFIILLIGYFIYPKPKKVEGEEKSEISIEDVLIIRGHEERTIKDEIKFKFGDNWRLAYAVMMSESRGVSTARNINANGNIDNGYWQINNRYHPNITLECTQNVKCSTEYAYQLSKGGTDWNAWYGYKNGGYLTFM